MTVNFCPRLVCAVLCVVAHTAAFAQPTDKSRPRPEAVCSADADCVMTDFAGCCGGCCPSPRAVSRSQLAREQQRCATMDCEAVNCAMVVCEPTHPVGAFDARCQGGICVAHLRSDPRSQECQTASDCTVVYRAPGPNDACRSSPCGCCPDQQPQAVPVSRAEERPRPAPRPGKKADSKEVPTPGPGFGLSEGRPDRPTPNCSPCPPPRAARAVCEQNRCVLASEVPRPR